MTPPEPAKRSRPGSPARSSTAKAVSAAGADQAAELSFSPERPVVPAPATPPATSVNAPGSHRPGRLGQPLLQVALLGLGLREVERAAVRVPGLTGPAGATKQLGPGRVEVPVMVKVEAVQDGQARFGTLDLGHGDGPVHLDDRGAGLLAERAVQGGDLPPVARLLQVQVRDGRLE